MKKRKVVKRVTRYSRLIHTSDKFKTRVAKSRDLSFDNDVVSRTSRVTLSDLKKRSPVRIDNHKPFKLNVFNPPVSKPLDKQEICHRRQERKEVLFAIGRTGKGGAKNKRPTWTQESYVRC